MAKDKPIIANLVKPKEVIPKPGVPSKVRLSVVPDPELTKGKSGDKTQFRKTVEATKSEVEETKEVVEETVKEKVFSREDEPVVKGTIVITVYKDHPYEVEFSGNITGTERDLAWRAMMKQYQAWKQKLAKEQEKIIKAKQAEEAKKKEAVHAGN